MYLFSFIHLSQATMPIPIQAHNTE